MCVSCGLERGVEAARSMAEKRGPYYERFLEKRWGYNVDGPQETVMEG